MVLGLQYSIYPVHIRLADSGILRFGKSCGEYVFILKVKCYGVINIAAGKLLDRPICFGTGFCEVSGVSPVIHADINPRVLAALVVLVEQGVFLGTVSQAEHGEFHLITVDSSRFERLVVNVRVGIG